MEFKEVTIETPDVKEQKERTAELIAMRHGAELLSLRQHVNNYILNKIAMELDGIEEFFPHRNELQEKYKQNFEALKEHYEKEIDIYERLK